MSPPKPVQLAALKGREPESERSTVIMGRQPRGAGAPGGRHLRARPRDGCAGVVGWLPALNALLNGTSAVFLVLALRAIKSRRIAEHARHMLGALGASAVFLVSYIVYHSVHGDTKFAGHGAVRPLYFFILISHIALSAVVLPLIFSSFFFSLSGRFPQHRKISRYTLPVWALRVWSPACLSSPCSAPTGDQPVTSVSRLARK